MTQFTPSFIESGNGQSAHESAYTCGRDAAAAALSQIHRHPVSVVIVYASIRHALDEVLRGVHSVVGDAVVIGTTTAGEVHDGLAHQSVVVTALASPYLKVHAAVGRNVSKDWIKALEDVLGHPALQPFIAQGETDTRRERLRLGRGLFAFLISPGNTRQASSQGYEILNHFRARTLGKIPIFAGCSADDWNMEGNAVLYGQQAYGDSLLLAIFETELSFGISIGHGFQPGDRRMKITRAEGHEILALDDQAAATALSDVLGIDAATLENRHVTLTTQRALGTPAALGQYSLNVAAYTTSRGGIRMTQPASAGADLYIMDPTGPEAVSAGADALRKALLRAGTSRAGAILCNYCALRPRLMGEVNASAEIAEMVKLADGTTLAGFCSFGEGGVTDDGVSIHNNASVSVLVIADALSDAARVAHENKRLLRHLMQENQKHQVLIRNASDGIHILDLDGNIQEASDSFCDMLGYTREEALRLNVAQWDARFPRETLSRSLRDMAGSSTRALFETVHRRKDGGLIDVEVSGLPIELDGKTFIYASSRDITERKRADERLRASERYLAQAQNIAHIGNWWLNVWTGELHWSDEIFRIFGCQPGEFEPSYERFFSRVHPDDVEAVKSSEQAAFGQGMSHSIDHRIILPDGSVRWVHEEAVPTYDSDGTLIFLEGTIQDITAQKQTEMALHESRNLLQAVVDNVPMRVFWKDHDLNYLGCNPLFARDAGKRAPDDLIGRDDFEMGWASEAELYRADDRQVIESGLAKIRFDERQTTPDGRAIWLRISKVPLRNSDNEVIGVLGIYDDITDIKATETQLRDSEQRFRHLFDSSPDPVWIIDGHRFVECNQAAVEMLGFPDRDALRHVHPAELSPEFQPDGARSYDKAERMLDLAQETGLHRFEWVHLRKDGSQFFVEVTLSTLSLQGKPVIHCTWRDITDRKEAQSRVLESEARFRALFEASRDAIVLHDGPLIIDCNPAALKLMGATDRSQIVGHTPDEFARPDPNDPRPVEERIADKLRGAIAGHPQFFEWPSRKLDGTEITLDMQLVSVDIGGKHYLQAISRDITERKQAERALHLHREELERLVEQRTGELFDTQFAMDKVGIGITWADFSTGRFIYSNQHAAQCLGYTVDELLQLTVSDIDPGFPPEDYVRIRDVIKRQGKIQFETSQRTKDGHLLPVEMAIYYQGPREGQAARLIAFQADISRRKAAELALVEAKVAAEAANKAKSAFLANMSHEIRTPLNAITGMAYLMLRDELSPTQSERLRKITVAGQHLLETINAILDLSKIEANSFVLESTPVSIDNVMSNIQAMIRPQAEHKGLALILEIEKIDVPLLGDATRLQQALLNYAANAVKFTHQGRITLRAIVLEALEQSMLIRFEVEDTGIGIAPESIPRLFNTFEQADSSTTRKYGGSGLGLAITRKIAQLMDGEAGADSLPGQGSRFWFTSRLKVGGQADMPQSGPMADHADAILARDFAGARVLLVEDEPVNREIAGMLLEDVGFRVDEAENGAEALELASRNVYSLILMDMQMPVMDGLEAARRLRQHEPASKTPILAMTANAFAEDKNRCLEAGMDDFLTKPVDPTQLYSTIYKHLSGQGPSRP